jgi:flavin-dependent dehydrogenase
MAARELARRRLSVLLIDRATFPRWKVCGCCLNGHALAILRDVDLSSVLVEHAAVPLRSIRLATAGRVAQVPLHGGVALSREAFDASLVIAAVQAGAAFLPQTWAWVQGESSGNGYRRLEVQHDSRRVLITSRVVVAADGLGGTSMVRSGLRRMITMPHGRIGAGVVTLTAPAFYRRGVIFMACGHHGYMGAVRLEDDRLNLAAAFDPQWVRGCGGLGPAAVALLAEVGWPAVPELAEQDWRGTPILTRRALRRTAERLFLIGDAAGYIEPFTGEGIAWALAAGKNVAPLAAQAVRGWHPELARRWDLAHEQLIGQRQRVCRAVATVLRSPWLTGTIIRLLAATPALAAPLTRYLGERSAAAPRRRFSFPVARRSSPDG